MESEPKKTIDIGQIRKKLEGKTGKQYWRSLEEVAETPEFEQWLGDEFPNRSSLLEIDRRSLLKFMGASMALAGLAGCRAPFWPNQINVPYVKKPEEEVPGKPLFFATGWPHQGFLHGVVVESHMGRPTKLDGNELSPNRGASNPLMQASVLNLYDPERSRSVVKGTTVSTWPIFLKAARAAVSECRASGGAGLGVLLPSTNSPTFKALIDKVRTAMPNAAFASWEPVNFDNAYQGTQMVFGSPQEAVYDLTKADVIVTLDADFLADHPQQLTMAYGWAEKRRMADTDPDSMNRMYSLECAAGITGASADHKLPVSTSDHMHFTILLAQRLGVATAATGAPSEEISKWVDVIVRDIQSRSGTAVVIPGTYAHPEVHALAASINNAIASQAVTYKPATVLMAGLQTASLAGLVDKMNKGEIKTLFLLGGDPAYSCPSDLGFTEALKKVPFSAHLGNFSHGTSALTTWHLPESHYLESWSDGLTPDGTSIIAQPLIAPLGDTRSAMETLNAVVYADTPSYELVRTHWMATGISEANWRKFLNDGIAVHTASTGSTQIQGQVTALGADFTPKKGFEVVIKPDPTIYDGRFVNNGWLQELPKLMSTVTWDNCIHISPKLAESLKVFDGDLVDIKVGSQNIRGPIFILPGTPENTAAVHFGYNPESPGMMSSSFGFNAYPIRTTASQFGGTPAEITKAGGNRMLALTQTHHTMEGRDIIRSVSLEEFKAGEHGAEEHHEGDKPYTVDGKPWPKTGHDDQSMYQPEKDYPYDGPQWAMSIDLSVCMGCHACVSACVAENNIAVVGRDMVIMGREMHWIRIDRYFGPQDTYLPFEKQNKNLDNPTAAFQPLTCMHCEQAPCEPVCPVAATVHSKEGLNQMVYNRCVGTRYCSNNCPYKVRRFNFLNFNDRKFTEFPDYKDLRVRLLVNNPDVTVRGRGVMEKCTYCVQRINEARINAKIEFSKGRRDVPDPKDGEVVTACQAACPTRAITFGSIADPNSQVSKKKALSRNYSLMEDLNTRNRTTYLHIVKNPNKELQTV